ncbi:uncharacterized protein LOC117293285 [Asterias rubens]|uniref:uncharacterized protein LOC117293285 n=1 Tax=Asterias rubens TaxID=7604 RepID=UPI0014555D3B|nr:uncharacterized protein LOC117293285 [Asterias rubens]
MSAGPLKRLRSSSSLDLLEDGDLIPWTFVSPQAEQSDNETSTTYTKEGWANKKRHVYKKKKGKVEVKSTSEASSTEWTDEEEYSLCQVVAISLKNASGSQGKPATDNNRQENQSTPHSPHNWEALLAKNMTRELQSLNISGVLAECFIPTHGHTDIVTRVKSSAFRRRFLGFLRAKDEQNKRLLAGMEPEEQEVISGEVGSSDNSGDDFQDEEKQELQNSSSTLRKCLWANKSNKKLKREKQSQSGESKLIVTEETDPNFADGHKKRISECITGHPAKKTVLHQDDSSSKGDGHVSDKHKATKRISTRLKKKQQQQSTDADTDSDKVNSSHFSPNLADDESHQSAEFIKKGREFRNERRNEQQETVDSDSLIPVQEGSRTGMKRNARTVQQANGKSVSQKLSMPDDCGKMKKSVRTGKQQRSTKFNKALKQPVKTNSVPQVDRHELHTRNAPILAAISPSVRHSQANAKENEKRSFKAFRKKLLDKTLEVQLNGPMLTSTFKPQGSNEKTKVCEGLDSYLMLQKVQQNRKNILDACLMVQRDTT